MDSNSCIGNWYNLVVGMSKTHKLKKDSVTLNTKVTLCGIRATHRPKVLRVWDGVTCKRCLSAKPKGE